MLKKPLLPLFALLGALFGVYTIYWSQKEIPVLPVLFPPPKSPYTHAIAATGMVEASSQNISIGCPFNEVITRIYVTAGDFVRKGDLLFELDLRNFLAQLETAKANLGAAIVAKEDKKTQYSFYKRLKNKSAVSEQELEQFHFAYLQAKEQAKVAEGNLALAKSNIERSQIRAPIDGQILQLNIHIGEIAPINPFVNSQSTWQTAAQGTLILMGQVNPLQLRIDIDEDEAWRYEKGSRATAFIRGNSRMHFPLTYLRIEPLMVPKRSFTGQTTQRIDTRVLQVLYNFEPSDYPVHTGQILDVFIEAQPFEAFVNP